MATGTTIATDRPRPGPARTALAATTSSAIRRRRRSAAPAARAPNVEGGRARTDTWSCRPARAAPSVSSFPEAEYPSSTAQSGRGPNCSECRPDRSTQLRGVRGAPATRSPPRRSGNRRLADRPGAIDDAARERVGFRGVTDHPNAPTARATNQQRREQCRGRLTPIRIFRAAAQRHWVSGRD